MKENNLLAFDFTRVNKHIEIIQPYNLYKWNKAYFKLQLGFFADEVKLVREKQIEDFIFLNGFNRIWVKNDTDIFKNGLSAELVDCPENADLMLILCQTFSRLPCKAIITEIKSLLDKCPNLYLGINRHYINIDNSYNDKTLSDDFEQAITQWLRKELPDATVIDHSFRWDDRGTYLSWSIPDRHYFITRK